MTRAATSTGKYALLGGGLTTAGFAIGAVLGGWAVLVGAAIGELLCVAIGAALDFSTDR
jgi:hypothetical protein